MDRVNKRAAAAILTAAMFAALGGCVVAIGNDACDSPNGRVALTPMERSSLPTVQSRSELPTIREKYSGELSRLTPTTTVAEFQALFPEARFVERKPDTSIEAYSLELRQKYRYQNKSYGYLATDEAWFYFKNGQLVKWGSPHDWP